MFYATYKDPKTNEIYFACDTHDGMKFLSKAEQSQYPNGATPHPFTQAEQKELEEAYGDQVGFTSAPNPPNPPNQPTNPPMTKTNPPQKTPKPKADDPLQHPWQRQMAPWINLLYILLVVVVFFVCLWNIGPYEVAVRFAASRFEGSGIIGLALSLPVLGWLLAFIGNAIFWIIGALIWGVIQLIELMPIVMTNHPGYVRSVLSEQEAHEQIRINQGDSGTVRHLKKFYNQLPVRFLILSRRLRGWIYIIDMAIVMMVYPPVQNGGIGRFFFLLGTGQWGQFDWMNIILLFATLLAVEAVVKIIMIVDHFRKYLKASNNPAETAAA